MKIYVIFLGNDGQTHGMYFDRIKNTSFDSNFLIGENGEGFDTEYYHIPKNGITLMRPATIKEMEDDVADQVWNLQHPA